MDAVRSQTALIIISGIVLLSLGLTFWSMIQLRRHRRQAAAQNSAPRLKLNLNLNMGIAHTHQVATQLVSVQLAGANLLALAVSALSVVAGTVTLVVMQFPDAWLLWIVAGAIGVGLAFLIEGLTLGALIRIRLASKQIREAEVKLTQIRDERLEQIPPPLPQADDLRDYKAAVKAYKLGIKLIEDDYQRKRRNATTIARRERFSSIITAFLGAIASACAGGLFYHTILSGLGEIQSLAMSALFALVVTGNFVSSELFRDIQLQAIKEGFAGGALIDGAILEETQRRSALVVFEGILGQLQGEEAQAELKSAALTQLKQIIHKLQSPDEKPQVTITENETMHLLPERAQHSHSQPESSVNTQPPDDEENISPDESPLLHDQQEQDDLKERNTGELLIAEAAEQAAPNLAIEFADVLQAYPAARRWIDSGENSISVDEIIEATGHSKRRIAYHARNTFARALQNPDRYTVTSVLKWLKTAPAPNTTAKIEVVTPENAVT
ncbi:MAG: ABC transporter ATP-binding protein, partial [Ktedonobacteraceae bacterium]|nr:ABC transporter ATP-binding protein [Ktedonobacteraceae bacterium]